MADDYLWDRSGTPDPEVQRLEETLRALRYQPRTQAWWRGWRMPVAAAAVLCIGTAVMLLYRSRQVTTWELDRGGGRSVVRLHEWLSTDSTSRVRLEDRAVGRVEVEPNSMLQLSASKPGTHRVSLQRGTVHALIWAPPGDFVIDTPSARTVDLGCAYTLTVDEQQTSSVEVTSGWVAFESHGLESFIPTGAVCRTRRGHGPGIPYYQDAPAVLQQGVDAYETTSSAAGIGQILAAARPRDAISVWHLLRRVPASERGVVFDRLAALVPIPPSVTRAGIVENNPAMIDALWDSLGLGGADWWRKWKQKG